MPHACSNDRRYPIASASIACGVIAAGIAVLLGVTAGSARAEVLRTGGPGAVTRMLLRAGAAFAEREPGTTLTVIPNLGSGGGIALNPWCPGKAPWGSEGRRLRSSDA